MVAILRGRSSALIPLPVGSLALSSAVGGSTHLGSGPLQHPEIDPREGPRGGLEAGDLPSRGGGAGRGESGGSEASRVGAGVALT